ncbi:MAG: prolipoprotein diacylglyceryl transferase [Chloroflexi bacterium]|nr:prolipoprotein diacylglyceryl transferase [Chloroflexota bacterium]MCL5276050.1 prolipoprotein diacylglyceryl transferase [Chloroflexota bacterium]
MSGPAIAIDLGFLKIHWYGIILTLGMVIATYLTALEAKRHGQNPSIVWDGVLLVIGLGLVGARLYHVFSTPNDGSGSGWPYYRQNLLQIFAIWQGGLGIFGGLVGGIIGIAYIAWRNKLRLFQWFDFAVPGVALAQAIGRWGNYANQELYGGPTGSSWWGITIDAAHRADTGKIDFTNLQKYPLDTRFHPTFFYESAWNFIGFILLMWAGRHFERTLRDGDLSGLYFIWYGIGRGWTELLFRPDAWTIGALPTAVWVSLGAIAAGSAVLVFNHLVYPRIGRLRPLQAA